MPHPGGSGGQPAGPPGDRPSLAAIQDAHKAAKYAVSSLGFDDWQNAIKYLNDALQALQTSSR